MSCSVQYQIFVKASSMPPSHRPIVGRYLCLLLTAAARGAGKGVYSLASPNVGKRGSAPLPDIGRMNDFAYLLQSTLNSDDHLRHRSRPLSSLAPRLRGADRDADTGCRGGGRALSRLSAKAQLL